MDCSMAKYHSVWLSTKPILPFHFGKSSSW